MAKAHCTAREAACAAAVGGIPNAETKTRPLSSTHNSFMIPW